MPRFGLTGGVGDLPAWGECLKLFSCAGLEGKITCPILNISTTGEGKLFFDNAKGLFDRLPNPKNRFVLTTEDDGGEIHCVRGNSSLAHQIIFDWLSPRHQVAMLQRCFAADPTLWPIRSGAIAPSMAGPAQLARPRA